MNIGIVTTWFERGAAYVSRQYRDLLRNEFNVFIFARGGEKYAIGDPAWDDGTVTWARKTLRPSPVAFDQGEFTQWIQTNRLDTVFFNEQQWWLAVLWCKEAGVKTGAYVDYYTEETIPLFAAYDFLICNTKRHFEAFTWHPGAHYVPWGTDIDIFRPSSTAPVEDGIVTFFHSAGMNPARKGTSFVLEAFAMLKGRKRLAIHSQVPLADSLTNQASLIADLIKYQELSVIEESVSAPGLYHLGDVCVYPSRLEGIGLTIAEALSCGLPVIVPDNPPMNEFVDDICGKTVAISRLYARSDGYYWPQCDIAVSSLIEQMQWYLDNSDRMADFKRQARRYAEEKLDWRKNKARIIEIFKTTNITNHFDPGPVIRFETERSNLNWISFLYMQRPSVYRALHFVYRIKKRLFP
jgi:glycosyltransferase involved in cell wall biosynthesis